MALNMNWIYSIFLLLISLPAFAVGPQYYGNFNGNGTALTNSTAWFIRDDYRTNGSIIGLIGASGFTGQTNLNRYTFQDSLVSATLNNAQNLRTALVFSNSAIWNLVISNVAVGFSANPVIGSSSNSIDVGFARNLLAANFLIQSASAAAYFHGGPEQRWKGTFANGVFNGGNLAFSGWYGDVTTYGVTFACSNLLAGQASVVDFSIAFESNDFLISEHNNSTVVYGGSTAESVGHLVFLGSQTTWNDSRFVSLNNATIQAAIYQSENRTYAAYNHCRFSLNGGALLLIDAGNPEVNTCTIVFNDCYLDPYTNGVVAMTTLGGLSPKITVIDGNLGPQHFQDPTKVTFISTSKPKPFAQLVGQTSLTIAAGGQAVTNYTTAQAVGGFAANAAAGTITNLTYGVFDVEFFSTLTVVGAGDISIQTNRVNTHLVLQAPDAIGASTPFSIGGKLILPANTEIRLFDSSTGDTITSRILTVH